MKKLAALGLVLMLFMSVANAGAFNGSSHFSGTGSHDVSFEGAIATVDYEGNNAYVDSIMKKGMVENTFTSYGTYVKGSFAGQYTNGSSGGSQFYTNTELGDDGSDEFDSYVESTLKTKYGTITNSVQVNNGYGAMASGNEYKNGQSGNYWKNSNNILDSNGVEATEQLNQSEVFAGDNNFLVNAGKYSFGKRIETNNGTYSDINVFGNGSGEYAVGDSFLESSPDKKRNMLFMRTDSASNNFSGNATLVVSGYGKSVYIDEKKENSDGSYLGYGQVEFYTNAVDQYFKSYLVDTRGK